MEKELLETFEAAKKAAEAAEDGGGTAEVDRCLDALKRLRKIPVTMKDLVDTQVGKRLRHLTKHPHDKIQSVASELLKYWKNIVIEETTKDPKKNNTPQDNKSLKVEVKSERAETIKVERPPKTGTVKIETVSRSESLKTESANPGKGIKIEVSKSETVKVEKRESSACMQSNGNETKMVVGKYSFTPNHPPKLTSMPKCNNPVRDKLRVLLAEAFSRVSKETSECDSEEVRNMWDEVGAHDPIRVAVAVESAMFERLGPSTGEHKVKYRSIMFNLKDSKNPDFRRRVLMGQVGPEDIVDMGPEEMASDERKMANKQIKDKAMFECERAAAPKASTDQFKCGRCGQRKTTYYQLQTRSADEPMTTFVTCVNCNNHWKFC